MMWRRKQSIVNFRKQFSFSLELLVIAFAYILICGFFLFVPPFNDMFIGELTSEKVLNDLKYFLASNWLLIVFGTIIFLILGVLFSHRLWGPLFGLERVMHAWKNGDRSARVRFRKYDFLLPAKDHINSFFDSHEVMLTRVESLAKEIEEKTAGQPDISSKASEIVEALKPKEGTPK